MSPLFYTNSPAFYILCVYFPPYFDHDAFMHHPMHVLDAPACDDSSPTDYSVANSLKDIPCFQLLKPVHLIITELHLQHHRRRSCRGTGWTVVQRIALGCWGRWRRFLSMTVA